MFSFRVGALPLPSPDVHGNSPKICLKYVFPRAVQFENIEGADPEEIGEGKTIFSTGTSELYQGSPV